VDGVLAGALGLFDHHHGIRALGHGRTGGDFDSLARVHPHVRNLTGVDLAGHAQCLWFEAACAERVFRHHGVTVHPCA
jgi:hypothetical protein